MSSPRPGMILTSPPDITMGVSRPITCRKLILREVYKEGRVPQRRDSGIGIRIDPLMEQGWTDISKSSLVFSAYFPDEPVILSLLRGVWEKPTIDSIKYSDFHKSLSHPHSLRDPCLWCRGKEVFPTWYHGSWGHYRLIRDSLNDQVIGQGKYLLRRTMLWNIMAVVDTFKVTWEV